MVPSVSVSDLRGLNLATGSRSLGGSVESDTHRKGEASPVALPAVAGEISRFKSAGICPAYALVSPEVITLCVPEVQGEMCRTSVVWSA